MTPKNLTELFNRFAGREVGAVEHLRSIELPHLKLTKNYTYVELPANEPTIAEMRKTAEDNGLTLRTWLPFDAHTDVKNEKRVNAYIDKGEDGKYRISKTFILG